MTMFTCYRKVIVSLLIPTLLVISLQIQNATAIGHFFHSQITSEPCSCCEKDNNCGNCSEEQECDRCAPQTSLRIVAEEEDRFSLTPPDFIFFLHIIESNLQPNGVRFPVERPPRVLPA